MNDPTVQVLMEQLQAILHPEPTSLPKEMVEALSQIPDKRDRFREAAMKLGLQTAEELKELADSMKAEGLLS